MDDRADRHAWRQAVKSVFALLPAASRMRLDVRLNERLEEMIASPGRGTLLGYAALPDEAPIDGALGRRLESGGLVAMPAWNGGAGMTLRRVRDLNRDLVPGRAGIREPRADLDECAPEAVAIALVPGRAFSESGVRLGRGAGCYDALFRGQDILKVGVAYDFQVFPTLPHSERDIRMEMVITPSRRIDFRDGEA
ncbi:MAG: 5-formyltetrahydrofolate cyclo-ligase [Planctomycetota bacterium]|jgi:5-formyltetrahydrofolate cyclo-ligase|nr:5-formyltetrahydrofolate cyclo-ligase [Planctomycetota bacterium]